MKILIVTNGVNEVSETFTEMFQGLSEKGFIIKEATDTKISALDKDGKAVEMEVFLLSNDALADGLKKEITDYRGELRVSMALLRKQGLVTMETLTRLGQQFEFLGDTPAAKKSKAATAVDEAPVQGPAETTEKE